MAQHRPVPAWSHCGAINGGWLGQFLQGVVLTAAFVVPAMAQQSTHRYVTFFKYNDVAVKAMTENPQDRSAQIANLAERFGGKVEVTYWFAAGGEYDGMLIQTFPDDITAQGQNLFVGAAGNLTKKLVLPVMTDEYKTAMEKAKNVKTSYTAPLKLSSEHPSFALYTAERAASPLTVLWSTPSTLATAFCGSPASSIFSAWAR